MKALNARIRWEWHLLRHSWVHYRMSRDFYRELRPAGPPHANPGRDTRG